MSGGNSVYSPLPQSNSDTDESSEEELHSSNESKIIHKISSAQVSKSETILNGQKHKIINYKPLDNSTNASVVLNGFQANNNEVSILPSIDNLDKLSTSRKICFLFSLFLCVFTIVVFLWVLPCDISSCPSTPVSSKVTSWEQTLENIELHGPISVVPAAIGKNQNLVFLFKSALPKTSKSKNNQSSAFRGGVISLLGHSGEVAWFFKLKRLPTDIDCDLIDVNLDGFNDCLVIGDDDMLKAIQPISGTEIWDIHGLKKNFLMYHFDFPLLLPDLNEDGVKELLTSCSFRGNSTLEHRNHLVIISGKSGAVFGDPIQIKSCSALRNLVLEGFNITYTCIDSSGKESVRTAALSEMSKIPFDLFLGKDEKNWQVLRQHKTESIIGNVFQIGEKRLMLENRGRCPDCNVSVSVKDDQEKNNKTVYTFDSRNSYGMLPVKIGFGTIKGFILKFWQWHVSREKESIRQIPFSLASVVDPKFNSKILKVSDESLDRAMWSDTSVIKKKRLKRRENSLENEVENWIVNRINERVVLITFNKTDPRFVNASHSEVVQLCKDSKTCQPDLQTKSNSLLLTDLDKDGSQELISYTTTYVNNSDDGSRKKNFEGGSKTWQLESKVRVVRLESELPKLYERLSKP